MRAFALLMSYPHFALWFRDALAEAAISLNYSFLVAGNILFF